MGLGHERRQWDFRHAHADGKDGEKKSANCSSRPGLTTEKTILLSDPHIRHGKAFHDI